MGLKICPRCQERIVYDDTCEDIIHECGETTASEVLRNEDVIVMGQWEDYTGSDTTITGQQVMMQGITNNIWGTRGAIEGGKVSDRTSRGNDTELVRTRKHEEFVELK